MSGDHNMHQKPRSYLDDFECPRCGHCCPQQTEQEPVAWMTHTDDLIPLFHKTRASALNWQTQPTPLYTAPPKKQWVGLTDEELKPLCDENHIMFGAYTVDFIQAIEAKLKEKNT